MLLQWNCDCLSTKADELAMLAKRYDVDLILLQETKLGEEDPTPDSTACDETGREAVRAFTVEEDL